MAAAIPSFHSPEPMKTTPQEARDVIYRGVWRGVGRLYNIKVEDGYTTIIVRPGEDIHQHIDKTKAKFVGQK